MRATPRIAFIILVSLAAACASAPHRRAATTPAVVEVSNQTAERIDVYLVTETQDRLLGRIEALARARLPLPDGVTDAGLIRLAVIAGARYTVSASRDSRAVLSLKQPLAAMATQEWVFVGGQLTPLPRPR
jgi:hypothetical protein